MSKLTFIVASEVITPEKIISKDYENIFSFTTVDLTNVCDTQRKWENLINGL